MKRIVTVLCILAAAVLLLVLGSRFAGVPKETPPTVPATEHTSEGTHPTASPPTAGIAAPLPAPPPAGQEGKENQVWAPHGRVVSRATGDPIFWTSLTYEVRFPISLEDVFWWTEDRRAPADGEEPAKDPGSFDGRDLIARSRMVHPPSRESLAAAEFRIRAQADGFARTSTDWIRWADFPRDRDLVVEMDADAPSQLLARVHTAEGTPFRGRAKLLFYEAKEVHGTESVESDAEGALVFEDLPSGVWRVSVKPEIASSDETIHLDGDGSPDREIRLPPGGRCEAAFVLAPVGEISLDVTAADGSAVDRWWVEYRYPHGSGSGLSSPRRLTGCPPGEYEVVVRTRESLKWKTTVRVDAGATTRVNALLERAPWSDTLKRVPEEVYAWLDRTATDLAKGDSFQTSRRAIIKLKIDDALDQLIAASGFGDREPDVITAFRGAWMTRAQEGRRTTSYGSGTFVVLDWSVRPGQDGGAPDMWWKGATVDQRKEWLLSWCAEKAGLVEVLRVRDDPCPACGDTGDRKSRESRPGQSVEGNCASCGGSRVIRTIYWR